VLLATVDEIDINTTDFPRQPVSAHALGKIGRTVRLGSNDSNDIWCNTPQAPASMFCLLVLKVIYSKPLLLVSCKLNNNLCATVACHGDTRWCVCAIKMVFMCVSKVLY
jgi:hypothetical protein